MDKNSASGLSQQAASSMSAKAKKTARSLCNITHLMKKILLVGPFKGTLDFQTFVNTSFTALAVTHDQHDVIVFSNQIFCDCFGFESPEATLKLNLKQYLFAPEGPLCILKSNEPCVMHGRHVSGQPLVLLVRSIEFKLDDYALRGYFMLDKTLLYEDSDPKKMYQHQLSAIFDSALVGIFEVNVKGDCTFSNAYLDHMLGRILAGTKTAAWLSIFNNADQGEICLYLAPELRQVGVYSKCCQIQTCTGTALWIRFHACPNQMGNGGFVGTITDETAQRTQELRLRDLADVDQLTGLVNRHVLYSRLQYVIDSVSRSGAFAVLCLDLDGFKNINDSLGHDVGDALLVEIANRLKRVTRSVDVVARIGGDEFAIVLANGVSEVNASRVAMSIIADIRKPVLLANRLLYVTVSIGIVKCGQQGVIVDEVLKHGDMALYQAKRAGKNNFQFFTPEMDSEARWRLDVTTQLHQALANNEFYVLYQPQLDVANSDIFGFEALLRWAPQTHINIYPSELIELLEATGLIHDVGSWIFEICLSDFSRWRKKGWISQTQKLSLNISPLQLLLKGFAQRLQEMCQRFDLEPSDLVLEINETNFMDRVLKNESVLQELKASNFALAIDNFGTGYSSILALIELNVDYLKINTSLLQDIFSNPKSLAVIDSILAIGMRLNIEVIAVGVDHPAKLTFLKERGCHIYQGYSCSRPMTAEHLERTLLTLDLHVKEELY